MRSRPALHTLALATFAALLGPMADSRAQDASPREPFEPRYCEPPPSGRSVWQDDLDAAVLTLRIGSGDRTLGSCSGSRARCTVQGSWPAGAYDVELRCQDWSWQDRVTFEGRENAIDASTALGDPRIVLHSPPRGLRLELEALRDGLAILPGRPRGIVLVSRRRDALEATARLDTWYGGDWMPPQVVGWPGHGYWLPEPVRVARSQRVLVPLFDGAHDLDPAVRYRVVVEAFTDEVVGALNVRRMSTLTMERTGRELIAR